MAEFDVNKLPKVRGVYKINEPLKNYTWLNVGGPADVLYFPEDKEDLQNFLIQKDKSIPVSVIGGGANLLVRDGGVAGVVIKLKNKNFCRCQIENGVLCCGAGLVNASLKKFLPENKIGGLEFICSIPGTIGGLIQTNAGCFGTQISDVFHKALVIDGNGKIFEAYKDDFNFSYRHSSFPSDWIILEVCFNFNEDEKENIEKIITQHSDYRLAHQPHNVRTAGSTFKNPEGYRAWELVKKAGGSELKIGGASFSPQHCNFLINDGSACAEDIEKLGEEIRSRVKRDTGITLEWEVKIIGNKK